MVQYVINFFGKKIFLFDRLTLEIFIKFHETQFFFYLGLKRNCSSDCWKCSASLQSFKIEHAITKKLEWKEKKSYGESY